MKRQRSRRRRLPGPALVATAERLDGLAVHLLRRHRMERPCDDLSPQLVAALTVVVRAGPIRMGRLAALEQVSPSTMSRLVAYLEVEGLVERRVGSRDRRHRLAVATERGKARIRDLRAERRRRAADLAAKLAHLPTGHRLLVHRAVVVLEGLVLPGRHPARRP